MVSSEVFAAYETIAREFVGDNSKYGSIVKNDAGEQSLNATRRYSSASLVWEKKPRGIGLMPKPFRLRRLESG